MLLRTAHYDIRMGDSIYSVVQQAAHDIGQRNTCADTGRVVAVRAGLHSSLPGIAQEHDVKLLVCADSPVFSGLRCGDVSLRDS